MSRLKVIFVEISHEYKTTDGSRLLQGASAQKGTPCPWAEDQDQCSYEKRACQDSCRQEEIILRDVEE